MSELTLQRLRAEGQAFMEEISRESYLAFAGLKKTAELQPIYKQYDRILGEAALDLTLGAFRDASDGSEDKRSAQILLEWEIESQASKPLAALDEREIEWENSAVIYSPDGRVIQYQAAPIEIANTRDRNLRLGLDEARAKLVEKEHAPLRLERLQREKDCIESLGVAGDYNGSFEAVTGISLDALAGSCEQFLRDTEPMWDDTLPSVLKKSLGVKASEAKRADALALFRASEYDDAFPANQMESVMRRQVTEMGIDPTAAGRIIFDVGEREGKRSRAFCSPVRVPEEVYLVMRPHGGQSDYNTFLHELGHALHFGYASPEYPFEFRWLGDNSVTESYAMLFDHRMQDRGWLLRYTRLGTKRLGRFLRRAGFEELHFLRRYCAKFLYERALYSGEIPWSQLPELYVTLLSTATGFEYNAADAFVDVDPRFYSARYLRAWQLQSVLNEQLTARFDVDWFRNPGAGPWLVSELFSHGQRETAEEISARAGGGSLSFHPLVRKIEALLET
ncbi:MAG TPA: M3 family metallopeptidase [Gemmatimonadaceae bacterium]|nr:M3 family metallopeptidase [Gemmatimonadaceae bacterium]